MKLKVGAAVFLLASSGWADITIGGFSLAEITSATSGVAASTYEIGYFATDAVPVTEADFATFTVISSISPKDMGEQQGGTPTTLPGQFQFNELISTRSQIGLLNAGDYQRRLGIRFFDSSGTESNIVSSSSEDWLLNDPEDPPLFGGNAELEVTDFVGTPSAGLVWQFAAGNEFKTVPMVIEDPVIISCDFSGGQFSVSVESLDPSTTYVLKRGTDLVSFPDTVGTPFTGAATHVFTDMSPPTGKAFYRVEEQ